MTSVTGIGPIATFALFKKTAGKLSLIRNSLGISGSNNTTALAIVLGECPSGDEQLPLWQNYWSRLWQ